MGLSYSDLLFCIIVNKKKVFKIQALACSLQAKGETVSSPGSD